MELLVDTRQQDGKHRLKHHDLEKIGYQLTTCKLDFGDYMLSAGRVSVDTKANIAEIHGNLTKGHERFRNECQRALDANSVLVVLVINKFGVRDLSSLCRWSEPPWARRKRKYSQGFIKGKTLARQMQTMSERYGVLWSFCAPEDAGQKIHELLTHEQELLEKQKSLLATDNE